MRRIALVTAIFGNLDDLKPVAEQSIPMDKYCFTDNPEIIDGSFDGWKIVRPDYPRYDLKNRLKAKYFRMLSHRVEELRQYDIVIWIDASIFVISPDFAEFMTKDVATSKMVFFRHSVRNCIYEEALASKRTPKYDLEPIDQQVSAYMADGYPAGNGLIETGCFAKLIDPEVDRIMESWWVENMKYSYQDQISLPYVLWKNKFSPSIMDKNIHDNEHTFRPARSEEKERL